MSSRTELSSHELFSVENFIAFSVEDKKLKSRLFHDIQSVIDDDLSEQASQHFAESYGLVAKLILGDWASSIPAKSNIAIPREAAASSVRVTCSG